jgi:hypothetical protein
VTPLRCSQMQDIAPDVALGLLTGEVRAAALAHLEDCAACRAEVASLAGVADELLLTGPEATPPGGFERRVLDRLAAARAADAPPPSPGDGPAPTPAPVAGAARAATARGRPPARRWRPPPWRRCWWPRSSSAGATRRPRSRSGPR